MNTRSPRLTTSRVQHSTGDSGIKPERWWYDLLWGLIPAAPIAALLIPDFGPVHLLGFYCAAALVFYVIICLVGMTRALSLGQRASRPPGDRRPGGEGAARQRTGAPGVIA